MLRIQENIALAGFTTFKIGGEARYFVEVRSEEELREALAWAQEKSVPFTLLAGGSNVLVSDDGFDGLVIHINSAMVPIALEDNILTADAGHNLLALIRECATRGVGGWEKLAGIPGTIGGAVRGNAGAFGSEIKDFVVSVSAINTQWDFGIIGSSQKIFTNEECDFSYRHSFFKQHPEWIIMSVQVRLAQSDSIESARLIEETIAERERRHLQNVCAAGSYFMNPIAPQSVREQFEKEKGVVAREGRVPAGWLIERAGMKGVTVGGAQASMQHPNYIVNTGNATSADVQALAEKVKAAVKEKFGTNLQEEAVRI